MTSRYVFVLRHNTTIDWPTAHNNGAVIGRWEFSSIYLYFSPNKGISEIKWYMACVKNEFWVIPVSPNESLKNILDESTKLVNKNIIILYIIVIAWLFRYPQGHISNPKTDNQN